ncbi:MAG: hypothetical protein BRD49_02965 [Bacteroidetes bacterium SW_10_40_5]|nr:MAG: hypothetical protein BRD49_02965 [Bacteroidetes bacterium SW_10_40_5]
MVDLIHNKKLPKGIIQRIYSHAERALDQQRNNKTERWRWLMAYDFSRMGQRYKSDEAKTLLGEIKNNSFTDYYQGQPLSSYYTFLELLHVAARWSELALR